jgi:hypothetical protein
MPNGDPINIRDTKEKISRIGGTMSESGGISSVVRETRSLDGETVDGTFYLCDCRHPYDPKTCFKDEHGRILCAACVSECCICHKNIYKQEAYKGFLSGNEFYCKRDRFWRYVKLFFKF